MELTPEQKDRVKLLVAALRSGEYKQGKYRLNQDGKYCCLGVACDVFNKQTGKGQWVSFEDPSYVNSFEFTHVDDSGRESEKQFLIETVYKWFGFEDHNPSLKIPNLGLATATLLNDTNELTFEQIADVFEQNFLKE